MLTFIRCEWFTLSVLSRYNDQDRFERSQATRFFLKELVKKNNLNVYEGEKKVNFQDAEQVFFGDLRSLMNEYYTIIGSQKITKVKKQNAEDGKSNGALPYGYTTDENNMIVIDDEESKIIENIFKWYLTGEGVSTIAKNLNDNNVRLHKKSKATKWNQTAVWRILKNSFYKGERNYGGLKYNNVKPIINPFEWEQAQAQLQRNKSNTGRKVKDKYILRGLLKCGICGRNYYGRSGTTVKGNYYFCSSLHEMRLDNCTNRGISHFYLDEVIFQIAYVFSKSKEKDKNIEDLKHEIVKKNVELKKLSKLKEDVNKERLKLVNAIVKYELDEADTKSEFQRIKENENKINSDIVECEKLIYNLNNLIVDFSLDTNKLINTFSHKEKCELVNNYIKKIMVIKTDGGIRHLEIFFKFQTRIDFTFELFIKTTRNKLLTLGFDEDEMFTIPKDNIDITNNRELNLLQQMVFSF